MADIAKRFAGNPILRPGDVKPSFDGLDVVCLLNPGVFRFQDKTWLLLRVAERPRQKDHMISTTDWQQYTHHGMILPPTNKDAAIFPAKIGDSYFILHRPSSIGLGGSFIWLSRSPDLIHWGEHEWIAITRPGMWDSARIGAGAGSRFIMVQMKKIATAWALSCWMEMILQKSLPALCNRLWSHLWTMKRQAFLAMWYSPMA